MYDGENLNTGETAETREETGWMEAEGRKVGLWHGWTWPDRDGGRGRKKEAQEKGKGRGIEAKGAGQQPAERPDGAAHGKAWPPSPAASEGSRCFQGACGGSLLTRASAARRSDPVPALRGSVPSSPSSFRLRQPLVGPGGARSHHISPGRCALGVSVCNVCAGVQAGRRPGEGQ